MNDKKNIEENVDLTDEEKKQVEKGIRFSRVMAGHTLVMGYLERVKTKLEFGKTPEEIKKDIALLKKAIADTLRLHEMWKKHPIHD